MFLPTSPRPPSGMTGMLTLASWQQAVAVPREERRLADVRETQRLSHEPAQTEREAAVRRHPVSKRVEVGGEGRLVQAALCERRAVVLEAVETLPAGDDLHATVEQVEAARQVRPLWIGMRVERTLDHREALDEDELAVLLADPPLVGGREVGLLAAADVLEADDRQLGGRSLADRLDHRGHDWAQDLHHVSVVSDEADLRVERDVLREMPSGLVRLRAENG